MTNQHHAVLHKSHQYASSCTISEHFQLIISSVVLSQPVNRHQKGSRQYGTKPVSCHGPKEAGGPEWVFVALGVGGLSDDFCPWPGQSCQLALDTRHSPALLCWWTCFAPAEMWAHLWQVTGVLWHALWRWGTQRGHLEAALRAHSHAF